MSLQDSASACRQDMTDVSNAEVCQQKLSRLRPLTDPSPETAEMSCRLPDRDLLQVVMKVQ